MATNKLAKGTVLFVRFQPKGLPLAGHTSRSTEDWDAAEGYALPEGYVFAFDLKCGAYPNPVMNLLFIHYAENGSDPDDEVVIFLGEDEYDPGDVCGVAVKPLRELKRFPFAIWEKGYKALLKAGAY